MPIVINRHTGEVISRPEITPQQKQALWEAYVRSWLDKHPEIFNQEQSAEPKIED